MTNIFERLYLARQVLLNHKAVTEAVNKGTVSKGQINYLDNDPKQAALFQRYIDLVRSGDEKALADFRNGLSGAQMADLLQRGSEVLEKGFK
jgi:hypothetical protein